MGNKHFKDMGLRIDKTSTLVDIGAYINNQSLQSAIDLFEDTGAGVANKTRTPGLADISVPINGWVNSTTELIFGPCLDGTAVSKTVEFRSYTGRYFNGECYPSNIQFSGSQNNLQTFSATLNLTGALNRTSVALT